MLDWFTVIFCRAERTPTESKPTLMERLSRFGAWIFNPLYSVYFIGLMLICGISVTNSRSVFPN